MICRDVRCKHLGKKLTGAGQNVAQQTKNITDVARLNNEITNKERAIAKLYAEIGRAYYDRHKDDPAAEELQMVSEVSKLCGEITRCKETIKQIKGIVKCPFCGSDVSAESVFCGVCGERIPSVSAPLQEEQETKVCPNCHASVSGDSVFCVFCGTKLD